MSGRGKEFELIEKLLSPLAASAPGAFSLKDDAAAISMPAGVDVIVTCDTLVETIHFFPQDPPSSVAAKCLAVNLSDLAAMGATPFGYLLSLALPSQWDDQLLVSWMENFVSGLRHVQEETGIVLLGGDTVATADHPCLTVTALGYCPHGSALRRSGAKSGDRIVVTGCIGDSALGLAALQGALSDLVPSHWNHLVDRYRCPTPRFRLGACLHGVAHAAIDVSDGLVADLNHVCVNSGVSAIVEANCVPLSPAAAAALSAHPELLVSILSGGDDYELLFTVPQGRWDELRAIADISETPVTEIGRIIDRLPGGELVVYVIDETGAEVSISDGGYQHF